MKNRLSLIGLLAALFCAAPAFAIVGRVAPKDRDVPVATPLFACMPAEFTLTRVDNGLRLHGALQMPTPGFTYDVTQEEPGPDGSLHGTLHLKAPGGIAAQVISSLPVDHVFTGEGDRLTVDIDRAFAWGDKIECKMAGITQ